MTQRFSAIAGRIALVCVLLLWLPAGAGQVVTSDYDRAVNVMFWPQLYRNGGETLYCRQAFDVRLGLSVEHVYALRWIERALDCGDTQQCRIQEPSFGFLGSDLHNMFPTRMGTDHARGDFPFGFIPGDRRDFGQDCNFKVGPAWAYAQPQPEVRGEIARAILYMMREYGLPLPERTSLELLRDWHHSDPPDAEDLRRNDEIERLQGNRNPFVDNPALADWFLPDCRPTKEGLAPKAGAALEKSRGERATSLDMQMQPRPAPIVLDRLGTGGQVGPVNWQTSGRAP